MQILSKFWVNLSLPPPPRHVWIQLAVIYILLNYRYDYHETSAIQPVVLGVNYSSVNYI